MLYLNPSKEKVLTFEVELSGASASEITGYVRFIVEGVEIGFPAIISDGEIKAVISPLKNFLKKPLKNGTMFEAQLDLYTEDQDYFSPWKGEIEVKMPVTIEAKLSTEESKKGSNTFAAKAKVVVNEEETKTPRQRQPKQQIIKEIQNEKGWSKDKLKNITEEQIIEYMERSGTRNPQIQQLLLDEARNNVQKGGQLEVFKYIVKTLKKPK